jgi:predicted PurR-regulated permease PerM
MWLHLGGSYWQRASVDAVIVVAALIGLVAFAPPLKRLESRHFWGFAALVLAVVAFGVVVVLAGHHIGRVMGPALHALELNSSP